MDTKNLIFHVTPGDKWTKEKDRYFFYPDSLKKVGFIYCATKNQIVESAEYLYQDKLHLKILFIDPNKVRAQIVYEDIDNMGHKFPHIYGALNLDAVIKVVNFTPDLSRIFDHSVPS